jgi:microcystin-dependent protein
MTQYFFKVPFADNGDTTTIPLEAQAGGEVSYDEGFGPDYQAASDDPDVLYPERPVINELYRAVTDALRILQIQGFPDWIAAAQNDGDPYPYAINAIVRYNNLNYISLVDANEATPGTDETKWTIFQMPAAFQTGDILMWESQTLRSGGWLWLNGLTIGNASSGATGRANADTEALFIQTWTNFPQSVRPLQNSSGAVVARGVSAAADFAANRRIPLRDMRDVVPAGTGTMGGIADRGLLTAANTLGVDGSVFGATGGEQQHQQDISEVPSHTHGPGTIATASAGNHSHTIETSSSSGNPSSHNTVPAGDANTTPLRTTSTTGAHTHSITGSTGSAGGTAAFNVVQPTTICNYIIKL